jgi:hypothetical protein
VSSDEILAQYNDEIRGAFEDTISGEYHEAFADDIALLMSDMLRRKIFSEGATGVVFAGFGDREIFPAAKSYMVDGVIAGRLRAAATHKTIISHRVRASIEPFAQSEMVYRFMEGH